MMRYRNAELRERLSAGYVLGTLRGTARRRFAHLLQEDRLLRACVEDWERRLNPLGEAVAPLPPPPGLWSRIQRRTAPTTVPQRGLWDSLPFWRSLGLATAGLVLVLAILLTDLAGRTPGYTAVIVDAQAQPVWLISGQARSRYLHVRTMRVPEVPPGMACALWLVWADGRFQPLGALPEGGEATIAVPVNLDRSPYTAAVLVTMEPKKGGSPPAPTGPVVFRGAWLLP